MKRMKLIGLSLLAIFALGAFAAATAAAEEGFLPSPTTANVLGKVSTLATAGSSIVCGELDASTITFEKVGSELEKDKHATGTLHWLKCKAGGLFGVNSLGDEKEVILAKVLFLVCLDPKDAAGKLIDEFGIAAETDEPVHLEVPGIGALILVAGRVIGAVLTTGTAKLFSVEFSAPGGTQAVQSCLNGAETKKHTLTSELNHSGTKEPATENVEGGLVQFPSEVKLMDS